MTSRREDHPVPRADRRAPIDGEAPDEAAAEAAAETAAEAAAETRAETRAVTRGETPSKTAGDTAGDTAAEARTVLTGLGAFATAVESLRQTVLMLRHRRLFRAVPFVLATLFGLAFLLGARASGRTDGNHLYCMIAWWGLGTVVVPWFALYLGVRTVHGEIEARTSQYLFLRPVGRVPLLLGKWLGVVIVAVVVTVLSTFVLFAAIAAHGDLWPDGREPGVALSFAYVLSVGVVAYAAVAVLLATTFRRPLAWGAFFVVGVQMLAANLPVSAGMRSLTITDPLRRLLLDQLEPSRRLARDLWPSERSEALDVFLDEMPEHAFAWGSPLNGLAMFTVICLALACWRYSVTEYESRSRD